MASEREDTVLLTEPLSREQPSLRIWLHRAVVFRIEQRVYVFKSQVHPLNVIQGHVMDDRHSRLGWWDVVALKVFLKRETV